MPVVNVHLTSVTSENISRFELLAWVNDCLQSNLSKIEEMSTAAAYCQLTDYLFPGRVQLKKVKWNSRLDVDWINNWRVLQSSWKDIGIEKPIPVQMLMKGKFQDNFEFLQWFRKFFDANYDGHEYDALKARNYEDLPAALPGGALKKNSRQSIASRPHPPPVPTSRTLPTRPRPQTNGTTNCNSATSRQSNATSANTRHSVTAAASRRSIAPLTNGVNKLSIPSTVSNNSNVLTEEVKRLKETNALLQLKLKETTENVTAFERENKFYYGKLRRLELMCDGLNVDIGTVHVKDLLHILYSVDENNKDDTFSQSDNFPNDIAYEQNGKHAESIQNQSSVNTEQFNGTFTAESDLMNAENIKKISQQLSSTLISESVTFLPQEKPIVKNETFLNETHPVDDKTLSFLALDDSLAAEAVGALGAASKNDIFGDLIAPENAEKKLNIEAEALNTTVDIPNEPTSAANTTFTAEQLESIETDTMLVKNVEQPERQAKKYNEPNGVQETAVIDNESFLGIEDLPNCKALLNLDDSETY